MFACEPRMRGEGGEQTRRTAALSLLAGFQIRWRRVLDPFLDGISNTPEDHFIPLARSINMAERIKDSGRSLTAASGLS